VLRLVLDTNVWLDWLAFADPAVAPVREAVARGAARVFTDEACTAEFERVLAYPRGKRTLDAEARAKCLEGFRAVAVRAPGDAGHAPMRLPDCRDPDDQKFLELARGCGADLLVTRDKALLALARRRGLPFGILTPAACRYRLAT